MPQLLSLSRAARLVGISRGALQQSMKEGNLPTFEGKIAVADLLQLYPHVSIEQDRELDRVTKIKDAAFARRVRERIMPDAEVLVARIHELGRELAQSEALTEHYRMVLDGMRRELLGMKLPNSMQGLLGRIAAELQHPSVTRVEDALVAEDSLLRVMTAHVHTQPAGHDYFVEGSDSLLEAGLRAGLALNYGCSDGHCGLCKARLLTGQVKPLHGVSNVLSNAERNSGIVLLCSYTAVTDVVIETQEAAGSGDIPLQRCTALVKSITLPTTERAMLHLQTPAQLRLRYLAGQSFRLTLPGEISAELLSAGCPCDGRNLYFHIGAHTNSFSDALFTQIHEGEVINIEGPAGDFTLDQDSQRPILFLAYELGFAPIKGLIEYAMALDNAPRLHLYWLTARAEDHYLDNLCRSWADALDNFHYIPVTVLTTHQQLIDAVQHTVAEHATLQDYDVYVAGSTAFVSAVEDALATRVFPRAQLHSVIA